MTFTSVFHSVKKRERQCMGFRLQMVEKLDNNSEEGYKIQIARCLFFKKTDVKVGKKKDWITRLPNKRDTEEKP
jgi:hypothetical protein